MTTQVTIPGDRSQWTSSDLNKVSDAVVELQGIANGGSLTAVDDITFTADSDASGVGDIVLKTGATERWRLKNNGNLGIGADPGTTARLLVRIAGTGPIAQFEPSGGGHQYYHFNDLGFGAVGDDVNLPYIAVESNTAQDIKFAMSVSNAAGNLATLTASSVSGASTPSMKLAAAVGDIYLAPGNGTSTGTIKCWPGFRFTVQKNDGSNTIIDARTGTPQLGFFGATPIAKYATTGTATGFTAGAGTAVTHLSTFTGNTGATAYTIGDLVLALKNYGLLTA